MILPGTTGIISDETSIYRGFRGFVQRISGDSAAVLFDTHTPWDKMVTFRISDLEEDTGGKQYYKMT